MSNNLVAFTHSANAGETTVARRCLDLLGKSYEILNIPQHTPKNHIDNNDTVVAFGQVAYMLVEQYRQEKDLELRLVQLPPPKQLLNQVGNEKHRYEAMKVINELKEALQEDRYQPQQVQVTEEDLPELDRRHIAMLQKMMEEHGKDVCFQVNKGGKLVQICAKPPEANKADMCITFEELYTIRQIMDVLKVKEVDIVNANHQNASGDIS